MKTLTRIITIAATVCFAASLICLLVAWNLGLNWNGFQTMIDNGSFSINGGHFFQWEWNEYLSLGSSSGEQEYTDEFTKLDIEFGAGTLEIQYGDVENVQVQWDNVVGYSKKLSGNTLELEGGVGVSIGIGNANSSLKIILPQDMELDEVDIEIGATDATIADIKADKVAIAVGAGQATVSDVTTDLLDIEVGAGQGTFSGITADKIDMEVGLGQLDVDLAGEMENYSYDVECGIGQVNVGSQSYSGVGASTSVKPDDAIYHMDIECGIGEINIRFEKK